jgi:hypothetical protein
MCQAKTAGLRGSRLPALRKMTTQVGNFSQFRRIEVWIGEKPLTTASCSSGGGFSKRQAT